MNISNICSLIHAFTNKDKNTIDANFRVCIANEKSEGNKISLKREYDRWKAKPDQQLFTIPQNIQKFFMISEKHTMDDVFISKEIRDTVEYVKKGFEKKEELKAKGLHAPNRIIMAGEPGNGKTILASAMADEIGIPFYAVNSESLVESSLGASPKNIASLLENIPQDSLVFFDEFDSIASSREGECKGASKETNAIVNSILKHMDRLKDDAIMIVATNRDAYLDDAIMRRFNLKLWVAPPESKEYAEKYINWWKKKTGNDFNAEGFPFPASYAVIENWCIRKVQSEILGVGISCSDWIGKNEQS